jgi:hypothetical protein
MTDYPSQSDRGRGALFKIPDEERKSDKYPIYRGDLALPDGSRWKLSGWVREDRNGKKFLSISAEPVEDRQQQDRRDHQRPLADNRRQGSGSSRDELDSEIPF